MQLLSLPSIALRFVANLQSWRRLGVATFAETPFASATATGKQGVPTGTLGSKLTPHGVGANEPANGCPAGIVCFCAAYASKLPMTSCMAMPRGFWLLTIEMVSPGFC